MASHAYESLDFDSIKEAALSLQKQDDRNCRIFEEQKLEIETLKNESRSLDQRISSHQTLKIKEDAKLDQILKSIRYLESNQLEFPTRDSAEIERKKVRNLRNQIQHRIKRNEEMKGQNAKRAERIKQMEDEMQKNEQFLVKYMQKLNRFGEIQKRFRAQFVLQKIRKIIAYFDDPTNGKKMKSEEESETEMLEEFILNAEIQKLKKINALNSAMQKKQNQFIAELNEINIPELDRFREENADLEMTESADIVEDVVVEDEETEDEEDDKEMKEGTVSNDDGNEGIQDDDMKEIKEEDAMQSVREEMEKTIITTISTEPDESVAVEDDDITMEEIAQKTGVQRMEERYLSDSELHESNKDVSDLFLPRNRALSQRAFAGIQDLPQLLPDRLSQMSTTPMNQCTNDDGMVSEQRKAASLQPLGGQQLFSLERKALSAEPSSKI